MSASTITRTEVVERLLEVITPGGVDDSLSDQIVLGPRGGMRGWESAGAGAVRPGEYWVTRAVCGQNHCSTTIRHGHTYWWDKGGPGRYAGGSEFRGLTLAAEVMPAVMAVVHHHDDAEVARLVAEGKVEDAVARVMRLESESV